MLKRDALAVTMLFLVVCAGCSESKTANRTVQLTSSPTPIPPNPSEISSIVWRFYHDQSQAGNHATELIAEKDIEEIASATFLRSHASTLVRDYGYIQNPDVSVTSVRGNAVDYSVSYDYISKNGAKLHWKRSGTWVLEHGDQGWQLNEDKWYSVRIVAVTYPDGKTYDVNDHVYADGRHVFDVTGLEVTFVASSNGWKTSAIALATPTPPPVANNWPTPPPSWAAPQSPQPTHPNVGAFVPDGCEDDTLDTVSGDGEILKMLSGAVYRVQDYDTSTSSVWLSTEDVLVCGDKIVNSDENGESVEAQRLRY